MQLTLADLREGEKGVVERLPQRQSRDLLRLGLCPGTEVVCKRRLPLGDPTVYRWRGIDAALRRRDTSGITIIRKQ